MYEPEIDRVYKSPEFGYVIIKKFSLEGPNITFEFPNTCCTNRQFTYTGVHKVSDFLHSLNLVQDINKELKNIEQNQQRLDVEQRRINQNKSFLEGLVQSQPEQSQLAEKTSSSEGSGYVDIDNPD